MFVNSALRLQRPCRARDRSASAILVVAKRFVANMGVPLAFRTDNGAEYTNSTSLINAMVSESAANSLPHIHLSKMREWTLEGHQVGTHGKT